jgi:hypothetical protein
LPIANPNAQLTLWHNVFHIFIVLNHLNDACSGGLSGIVLHEVFHPLLSPAKTTLTNTHATSNISLGYSANGEVEKLLKPLSHPLSGINATTLNDISDLVWDVGVRSIAVLARVRGERSRGVKPLNPPSRNRLADGVKFDIMDRIQDEDGKADEFLVLIILVLDVGGLLLSSH